MIDLDKPVRVFKNWKHGCYTIMQGGTVKASARQVRLTDVEFRVRESGRQRSLREQKRNVHAFAVGTLLDFVHPDEGRSLGDVDGRDVFYLPSKHTSFVDRETAAPVTRAGMVQFDESGAVYLEAA